MLENFTRIDKYANLWLFVHRFKNHFYLFKEKTIILFYDICNMFVHIHAPETSTSLFIFYKISFRNVKLKRVKIVVFNRTVSYNSNFKFDLNAVCLLL